jgi:hypothetical protein
LTAAPGTWSPAADSYTYQWNRGGVALEGATASTYDLQVADAESVITVTVTATTVGYSPTAQTSAGTAAITGLAFDSTSTPTLTGVALVGETLTAHHGAWSPSPDTFTYAWKRGSGVIEGAAASTYVLQAADAGQVIAVVVTAVKAGYAPTGMTSSGTDRIVNIFRASPVPVISGTATVGEKLTAVSGTWLPSPTLTYAWKRDGITIRGATSSGYKLVAADASAVITAEVTGSRNGFAPATVASAETSVVAAGVLAAATPTLSGTPTVGQKLTATAGSWSPSPGFTYVWKRDGAAIAGATMSTYRLAGEDEGAKITVEVTGSRSGYSPTTMTSAETDLISAPAFSTVPIPTISGIPSVGQRLTVVPGVWAPAASWAYVWKRDGAIIAGARASGYRLAVADAGKKITVEVTGTRSGYTPSTQTSLETATVAALPFLTTPTPTITGIPEVGQTLKANRLVWSPSADSFTYQWTRNDAAIDGATSKTYDLQPGDIGATISVTVTAVKVGYLSTPRTYAGTAVHVLGVD